MTDWAQEDMTFYLEANPGGGVILARRNHGRSDLRNYNLAIDNWGNYTYVVGAITREESQRTAARGAFRFTGR